MPHRNEQPTLFELTACDEFESLRGLPLEHSSRSLTPKSDPSSPGGTGSPTEPGVFRAVSPWAGRKQRRQRLEHSRRCLWRCLRNRGYRVQ
jgi:hypothetical protein